jgi:hypothetical protein
MSFMETSVMAIGKVLVGLDLREGLHEQVIIQQGYISHSQILDYSSVPFKCIKCHKYGHLVEDLTFKHIKKI